ncbi:MAG: InlB B-repeat-containing protein, partial [Candidatus Saccharibacteria bacterium]|nr:InlB B-repeat-containing protein [Candidatus Saccharibacteria bacterium]
MGGAIASMIVGIIVNHNQEETNAATLPSTGKMVEVRVLNTQSNSLIPVGERPNQNESMIIKTRDNKYVLIDTGNDKSQIRTIVYNALKDYQGTSNVVIDYMFISHLDGDHVGSAYELIGDNKITVKNLIIKDEDWMYDTDVTKAGYKYDTVWGVKTSRKWYYIAAVASALKDGAKIYTTNNVFSDSEVNKFFAHANNAPYTRGYTADSFKTKLRSNMVQLTEGMSFKVGDYLTLNTFNTQLVYDGTICSKDKDGWAIGWYAYTEYANDIYKTSDGKYVYFDSNDYPNITLKTTNKIIQETGVGTNKFYYRYYYAFVDTDNVRNICLSNAESLAILGTVSTNGGNKYMYFPNDIENAGYDFAPSNGVFGNSWTSVYKNPRFVNGRFETLTSNSKFASETEASRAIKTKLGADVKNIVIYQMAHHSYNVAPDAINMLDLNRSDNVPYTIATTAHGLSNSRWFEIERTYYYALGNLPSQNKMRTTKDNDGVYCSIAAGGSHYCRYYSIADPAIVYPSLSYNANTGSSAPGSQSCERIYGACNVTVASATPTRSGYTFLGWADTSSATTAKYEAGDKVSLLNDKTIYAVWKQNVSTYSLSYNANGGTGAPTSQSCTTTDAQPMACTIVINDQVRPTRENYVFIGWATKADATKADYKPGDSITINNNMTLYAFYGPFIPPAMRFALNFDANGGSDAPETQYCETTTGRCSIVIGTGTPIRSGYAFLGWASTADAATVEYRAGDSIVPSEIVMTLYAVWERNEVAQVLSFENGKITKTYGDASFINLATNNRTDGGVITYTINNTAVANINAQSGEVTIVGAGDVVITATAAATDNYGSATASYALKVEKKVSTAPSEIETVKRGMVGAKLSTIAFDTDGLSWREPDESIKLGSNTYAVDYTYNNDSANYTTGLFTIEVIGQRRVYNVVEGDGQVVNVDGKDASATFVINAEYGLFLEGGTVCIDGVLLPESAYTSEMGSTIIHINGDYLRTIESGEHSFIVSFSDNGVATARLTVARSDDPSGGTDDPDEPDGPESPDDPDGPFSPDAPDDPDNP